MPSVALRSITFPILLGALLNSFLLGTLLVQIFIYHSSFPEDSRVFKGLVYFIGLAVTVDTCLNISDVAFWFGTSFGDLSALSDQRYAAFYVPIMGTFVALLAHLFFSYRIWVIRREAWPFCLCISLISLAVFVSGLLGGIFGFIQDDSKSSSSDVIKVHDHLHFVTAYIWFIGLVTVDVLTAVVLTVFLLKAKVNESSSNIVNSIIRLVLETNMLSASFAILALVSYLTLPPANTICAIPAYALSALYANTILATLNNRAIILRARAADADKSTCVYVQQVQETFSEVTPPFGLLTLRHASPRRTASP
ncbi:hypothetical protein R3P38DRAFT_3253480 [Favolaschia claudopus]|uniref:DUF6534 domain-containing protein n=1 Tax=Favolaschia claudopus TaxID=2862362 RepID=A0AAW0DVM4_9AGAR